MFCDSAPKVNLTTNATKDKEMVDVTEESDITFKCDYDDVTPQGNKSFFSFNGTKTISIKVNYFYCFFVFLVCTGIFIWLIFCQLQDITLSLFIYTYILY